MPPFTELANAQYISLETYRESGEPVRTPVLVLEDGGTFYIRTDSRSGKVKRIRRDPRVRLAPCNATGQVQGEWVPAKARTLEGDESKRVLGLFGKKYRVLVFLLRVWHKVTKMPPYAVIAITPT